MRALVDEVELRLGTRAAHDAAVERYRQAATTFRRDRLIAAARAKKANAEAALRDDVADYLFARGFEVFVEVKRGIKRLDLVAPGALLVEAKCLQRASNPSHAIGRGVRQVLDYARSVAAQGYDFDPFLVLFRLGGPQISMPNGAIQIGNQTIRIVVVDLVEPGESGSNAPPQVELTVEDIAQFAGGGTRDGRRSPQRAKRSKKSMQRT